MKTPKYFAAYALMPEGYIDLALCPDLATAEIVLGQHKMSNREKVGITYRAHDSMTLHADLRDHWQKPIKTRYIK